MGSRSIKLFKYFVNINVIEWLDDRENYGEERINLIGICDGVILYLTYTMRGDNIRIISARRSEKHEQAKYYRENSP